MDTIVRSGRARYIGVSGCGGSFKMTEHYLEVRPSKSRPDLGLIKGADDNPESESRGGTGFGGQSVGAAPSKIDHSFRILASTMAGRDVPTVITRCVIGLMPSAPTLDRHPAVRITS
ncbi:MAG TPA: hypothetical protein VMF50_02080 [Candidatus Binataceae bacterium]|nr:hypothetical protein [Candidatus Binataceae bacterium]